MTHRDRALELVRRQGMARARDFATVAVPRTYLRRMTDAGDLVRLARGLYQEPDRMGEHASHDLAEASRLVPGGVISLISALRHHGLTTQLPGAVWMTIAHKARMPRLRQVRLEIVRATGDVLTAGIERVSIEGVDVPIYGIAKTIADCFKHRRHVGEDVAVEALRDALRQRLSTPDALLHYARIDRVATRMAPLIEAMQ
ncbi:type IV toxin-antitoxin system AbiEi family antitoxin domain-containing protein [Sphingomonas sp. RT2P30]|uniref:type IV toxin-antitoxin system AbiEi family antitoxin domain-containing protein n=1 Tax=Parasphingomonas halimpatiens TaxID=3096162 RepID=UPI002FCAC4DA